MSYSISCADLNKDRATITSLWERNFYGHGVPAGRFDWIYANNPYGKPTCFLLKHNDSNSVVGSYSLFPRGIVVNGKHVRGYVCGDLVVDSAHRALGPALCLVNAALSKCEEDETSVLFGFPNDKSEPVLLFAGFEVICDHIEMTKIIKTYPYLEKIMKFKPLARTLSYLLDILLHCRHGHFLRSENDSYEYDIMTSFDERFDHLWEKIGGNFSLKGEVGSRYLNWRFKDSPYTKPSVFTMTSRVGNSLVGYVVFYAEKKRVTISDIAFLSDNGLIDTLISAFYKHQKSQGIDSIAFSLAGDVSLIAKLRKNGFYERSRKLKTIIYTSSKQKEIISEIKNGNWYLTSGDNDI